MDLNQLTEKAQKTLRQTQAPLARQIDAPDDLVDTVWRAAAGAVLGELAQEHDPEPTWPWLSRRLESW
jgi:hypothetical protein